MLRMIALLAVSFALCACRNPPLLAQSNPTKADSTARDTTSHGPSEETVIEVDEYPVPIQRVPPVYPMSAQMMKITGKVLVKVLISKEGEPMMAKVYKSDAKELDEPSIESVMKWRFKPAMLNGMPVEFWVVIPFQFNLKK